MTVSLENLFYLHLGILQGWAQTAEPPPPKSVCAAIDKLRDIGLGVIGKSEEQLREEVEAQARLLSDALNDIDDLKALRQVAVALAEDDRFKPALPEEAEKKLSKTPDTVPLEGENNAEPQSGILNLRAGSAPEPTIDQRAHAFTPHQRPTRDNPLIRDDQLDEVKADFEAGVSFARIGKRYGCSETHVRNFLTRHGIDPRRTLNTKSGGTPPLTEQELQLIVDEKAKGTASKQIGQMINRSQHAVDQKYSDLKKAGRVPEQQLTPDARAEKKHLQNIAVSERMKKYHADKRAHKHGASPGEA